MGWSNLGLGYIGDMPLEGDCGNPKKKASKSGVYEHWYVGVGYYRRTVILYFDTVIIGKANNG